MYNIFNDLMNYRNQKENYIEISNFTYYFKNKHADFAGTIQQVAIEFCRVFLSDIRSELNEIEIQYKYEKITNTNELSKKDFVKKFSDNFLSREKSFITELFYSQLLPIYTIECKKEIYGSRFFNIIAN